MAAKFRMFKSLIANKDIFIAEETNKFYQRVDIINEIIDQRKWTLFRYIHLKFTMLSRD